MVLDEQKATLLTGLGTKGYAFRNYYTPLFLLTRKARKRIKNLSGFIALYFSSNHSIIPCGSPNEFSLAGSQKLYGTTAAFSRKISIIYYGEKTKLHRLVGTSVRAIHSIFRIAVAYTRSSAKRSLQTLQVFTWASAASVAKGFCE